LGRRQSSAEIVQHIKKVSCCTGGSAELYQNWGSTRNTKETGGISGSIGVTHFETWFRNA
jgi:hypothetical protein